MRKFRKKNWVFVLSLQVGIIFYSLMYSLYGLTGTTNAYFNDTSNVSGTIQAGTWETDDGKWDKSSLEFLSASKDSSCSNISAVIVNKGEIMQGPVKYEVWWAEKGNPKGGNKVDTGQMDALTKNQKETLTYLPTKNGVYMFKAFQRPGHPGNGELWSDGITVTGCSQQNTEEDKSKDENKDAKKENVENETEKEQKPASDDSGKDKTEEKPAEKPAEAKDETKEPDPATDSNTNEAEQDKENVNKDAEQKSIDQKVAVPEPKEGDSNEDNQN
ncbi:amyloid fiber anchoring/assembly protein TapA [Fictibacillus sp. WQ 8-8]|uniref:amyloid fiber anchoring/assembly protein TapA n=1 Tax=Fictibacillus sp. WQ 8-8 TaxID=2938788 RepID=UPI00210DCBF6|nr:amyloid fiber anchoring/assembly protein TapA [Fictibacillus sp. WQ 8-8]MCQ6268027.1 amyloid fiber anchoring/assembly protein TapA [Fictibacillus sp. WQ 8-8]